MDATAPTAHGLSEDTLQRILESNQMSHGATTRMDVMALSELERLRQNQLHSQAANVCGKRQPMQGESHNRKGRNHWASGR